jgi:hypothetical protein
MFWAQILCFLFSTTFIQSIFFLINISRFVLQKRARRHASLRYRYPLLLHDFNRNCNSSMYFCEIPEQLTMKIFRTIRHKSVKHNHIYFYLRMTTYFGLHRRSSGQCHKAFKMRQNYSANIIRTKGSPMSLYILLYAITTLTHIGSHSLNYIFTIFRLILKVL